MKFTNEELLKLVGEERKRSIGFGEGDSGELQARRERALRYSQGDVSKDVPALQGRSAAVSTDVAEAIETALPDILDIFIDGDDVATFPPMNEQDEEQAREESDYVKRVVFSDNEGFVAFYTAIKDALQSVTGVFHWWWEQEDEEEEVGTVPGDQVEMAHAVAMQQGVDLGEGEEQDDGSVVFKRTKRTGKVCIRAYPPEDFTVAADTVSLRDATYCAVRDRPRVQDLIARGIDAETARGLKGYSQPDQTISDARDEAGENRLRTDDATGDLRQVEVRDHYIRLLDDGDKLQLWKITTDSEETVLIDKEEVEGRLPFGVISPYLVCHRLYGESLADKLLEVQRIKTTLLRMQLDSGYFALNQRLEVDMTGANEFTISDLLNNQPNMPIRTQRAGAVTPISSGGLAFDTLAALEYVSVMGEARTGVVRNAQGLNPDTLHDTAKGAMALMTEAKKRMRLIARVIAETGVKDLWLGVHELLRRGYGGSDDGVEVAKPHVKMADAWKDIDPSTWPARKTVDVGVGSSGREADLIATHQVLEVQQGIVMAGNPGGIVQPDNVYAAARRLTQSTNLKAPESFFTDPAKVPPQPPKPDPEMAKVQAEMQLKQADLQMKQQEGQAKLAMSAQEGQQKAQLSEAQAQRDHELKVMQLTAEMQLKREQLDQELQLKREQLVAELQLKRELGLAQAAVAHETGMAKVNASTSQVEPGGEPG